MVRKLEAMESYILVPFPEVQEFMEKDWFDVEAILALGAEESVGNGAYFIPASRILNLPFEV